MSYQLTNMPSRKIESTSKEVKEKPMLFGQNGEINSSESPERTTL